MIDHRATWRFFCVALSVSLALLGEPAMVQAQSRAELREARDLFRSGPAAAREERWVEARTAFEGSLAITERASTLLNLAAALAETGSLLESVQRYERFLEIANGRDARQRPAAEEALARVRQRLPRLELDASALEPGDRIEADGEPALAIAPADGLTLDPGSHHVAVRRADDVVFEAHRTLAEGDREVLTLTPRAAAPTPREVARQADVEAPDSESGAGDDALAIGLGVGIGAAVVAAVAIVLAVVLSADAQNPYEGNLGGGVIRF